MARCGRPARWRWRPRSADVVQAHVAEAALLPVAAVRHGELVPAPVAPQPVHGVEHVQQRQVAVQRQAVPGGRAHLGKGDVGFHHVDVLHGARRLHRAQRCAPAAGGRAGPAGAPAAPAAGARRVERHVVKVVEHARLGQLAQLGVDKAAAQHGDDVRVLRLDGLRNAKGRIHRAGEGHRQQHHGGPVALDGLQGQARSVLVHQVGRRRQRLGQRVEGGLAARQRLGVAHELKARVHRIAQHIGQVVQVQRGQVLGAVRAGPGRQRPSPAGRRPRRPHTHPAWQSAAPRAGNCGPRCGAPACCRAPAGRRWRARWWPGSGRRLLRKAAPQRCAFGRRRIASTWQPWRAGPAGDSRRSTSASARSSCTASTPRERRKPVR
jgi:hypothetical protein